MTEGVKPGFMVHMTEAMGSSNSMLYFSRLGPGLLSIPDLRSRALMTSDRTLVWASIGCVAKNTVDLVGRILLLPADRHIKKTLLEHLKEEEVRITIPEDSNNKTVHSLYVHRVIDRMESNKVLNDFPPVNPDKLFKLEKNLTREQEVRICQLRSGYSPKLNGYLHRIGGATDPECRKCRRESETVRHMMSCYLNRPPEDLWNSPGDIAKLTDDLQQTKGL